MTKEAFKKIDIAIFAIIAVILEVVIYCISGFFKSDLPIFVSFSIILSLISIYRWGVFGSIVAVAGGIASAIVRSFNGLVNFNLFIIYGLGNAFVALSYLLLIKPGRKKISENNLGLVGYELFGYTVVLIGRSIIALILTRSSFTSNFISYIAPECLGFVIGIVILMISNKPNGVLVEMNQYIIDVHKEMENDKLHLKKIKDSDSYDAISDVTTKDKINDASLLDGGTLDESQLKELQLMFDESLTEIKDSERMD